MTYANPEMAIPYADRLLEIIGVAVDKMIEKETPYNPDQMDEECANR